MSNAYPWFDNVRDFTWRKWFGRLMHNVAKVFLGVAAILSLLAPVGWLYSYFGFERSNDTWYKRGLILFGIGLPVTAIVAAFDPLLLVDGVYKTIDAALKGDPVVWPIIRWQLYGAGPGLLLTGLASMGSSYHFEFASEKYLRPIKNYGLFFRWREGKNTKMLAEGKAPDPAHIAFGIHDEDTLPWRSRRHGMIVGRKADKDFGHGVILGAAGSGKSVQAVNIFDQCMERGFAGIYADFKGSKGVERALRDMASRLDKPFYSFSLYGSTDEEGVYYDPLEWPGLATDKAAVIVSAMPFAEGGGSQFYKNAVEAYLPVQLEVMEKVGRLPGEGTFDFLANTCSPSLLLDRAKAWATDPATKPQYNEWKRRVTGINADTLEGLRGNLNKIINSGGKYLRPPVSLDSRVLDLREAVDEGAIIYFSFATSLDAISVVTIGALLIQDITALIGKRMGGPTADLRPVLFMPDETSVLEERAELLDNMLRQAREAKVWVWPIAQSLVSWPESTRNEVLSNARTKIAYNVPDKFTQDYLVGGLSKVPWLTYQSGTESEVRAGGRREVTVGGRGFAKVDRGDQLTPGDLNLRDREAYIWFTGGSDTWLTIRRFRRHRVRQEEIEQDIVQIKTIARASVLAALNSAGPEDASLAEAARVRIEHAKARGIAKLNGDPVPASLVQGEMGDTDWGDDLAFSAPTVSQDVDPVALEAFRKRAAGRGTEPSAQQGPPPPQAAGAGPSATPSAIAFPFQTPPAPLAPSPDLATPAAHATEPIPTALEFDATEGPHADGPALLPPASVGPTAPGTTEAVSLPAPWPTDSPAASIVPANYVNEEDEGDLANTAGSVSLLDSLRKIREQTPAPEGFTPARRETPAPAPKPDWLPARKRSDVEAAAEESGAAPLPSWLTGKDEASA